MWPPPVEKFEVVVWGDALVRKMTDKETGEVKFICYSGKHPEDCTKDIIEDKEVYPVIKKVYELLCAD